MSRVMVLMMFTDRDVIQFIIPNGEKLIVPSSDGDAVKQGYKELEHPVMSAKKGIFDPKEFLTPRDF